MMINRRKNILSVVVAIMAMLLSVITVLPTRAEGLKNT